MWRQHAEDKEVVSGYEKYVKVHFWSAVIQAKDECSDEKEGVDEGFDEAAQKSMQYAVLLY